MRSILAAILNRHTIAPRYPEQSRVAYSGRTTAGVNINADNALKVSAVWACTRYLSQTVAVLPWHVMKATEKGADVQRSHPVDFLIWKRTSPEWSSFQFRETLTHWALRHGNGYAEIETDTIGRPYRLHPTHPDRVDVKRAFEPMVDANDIDIAVGELFYEINNGVGDKTVLAASRMFHIRGFGEGPVGVNVMAYAAESIGWAAAAQIFGAAFFGNGQNIAGVVVNKTPINADGLKLQKAEFEQTFKGPRNAHKLAHLGGDGDVKRLSLDAQETQLIPAHQHLVEEICRWFGVPPHKVAHLLRSTFSNIEHQAIEVVVDSITPWAKRFEDEADAKLFGQNRSAYYTKMNMNALLRGDMKARMEFYKGMQFVGAYTPNKILQLEDENTIGPDGDIHVMQQQMIPLDQIGQHIVRQAAPSGTPDDGGAEEDEAAAAATLTRINALLEHAPAE